MVPAQQLMDIDPDYKKNNPIKAELDINAGIILAKADGIGSACIPKCEETFHERATLLNEQTKPKEDVEVDIITYKNNNEIRSAEGEDPDATECSSSFADTLSHIEKYSGLSENEVESQFFDDSDLASPYDAFSSIFQTRKKKLTDHWRSFVRPLMWRCKWTELKIKEVESQALKYAKELTAYEQIHQSPCEGFCSKSLPFSNQCYRRKAIKRRKRKRIEDTTDTTSYMLHHSLFSYLESKRINPDGSSMIDDFENTAITEQHVDCDGKFGIDSDQLSFELKDSEDSLEKVLWKIEIAQTWLHKLKNQLDVVISKNATKFSSSETLSLLAPGDGQTSSAPSPTFSAGNGETMSVGAMPNLAHHISGYDIGDLGIPDSAISNYVEAIHVPDIIESTVGMLSAADVTFYEPQRGESCEDIVENVLINGEAAAEGDGHTLLETSIELVEKHNESEKGEGESSNPCQISTSEPGTVVKTIVAEGQQSVLRSYLASDVQFPRNKRKRGERKAGSLSWNKKSSGEPDSQ